MTPTHYRDHRRYTAYAVCRCDPSRWSAMGLRRNFTARELARFIEFVRGGHWCRVCCPRWGSAAELRCDCLAKITVNPRQLRLF